MKKIVVLAAATMLAGCSHNLVVRPSAAADGASGVTYVLPFTQFATSVTWRVASCAPIKITAKAETQESAVPDGVHAYTIDPASLQTLTSIGAFKATYADGGLMLSSINVSSEDRTGQIIGNVASGIAKLAAFPIGRVAPSGEVVTCSEQVAKAVDEVQLKTRVLDTLNGQMAALTADLQKLAGRAAAMGNAVDEPTKAAIAAKMDQLEAKKLEQDGAAQALAAALKKITFTQVINWPENSSQLRNGAAYTLPKEAISRWFSGGTPDEAVRQSSVFMDIERLGTFGKPTTSPTLPGSAAVSGEGIRYRIPGMGRLRVCASSACAQQDSVLLLERRGQIAQLGYVHVLPVRNRTFGSTNFAAEFTTAGALKSVGYEQKAAPAEGASAAFANAADLAAKTFSPTARLEQQTAYLTALQKRNETLSAVEPASASAEELQSLAADNALRQAQIQNVQYQIAQQTLAAQLAGN